MKSSSIYSGCLPATNGERIGTLEGLGIVLPDSLVICILHVIDIN